MQMDALDRRLVRELQRDCTKSALALADLCGTTESTALRRIRQLRESGIVRRQVAVVDPARVGRPLMLFVKVRLEKECNNQAREFVERIGALPEVVQFFFVTGSSDYMILLSLRSMEDYDRFLQTHLIPDPIVVMSDTNVVIRPIKLSLEIPIDIP